MCEHRLSTARRLGGVESDFGAVIDDSAVLKFWYLRDTLHYSGAPMIGMRLGIRRPKIIRAASRDGVCLPEFYEGVLDAEDAGILSDCEGDRLIATDLIMSGVDLGGAEVYVVAEVAFALSAVVIDRALYCAELFGKVYPGRDVRSVLWYVKADEGCRNAAKSKGVELVRTEIKWLEEG